MADREGALFMEQLKTAALSATVDLEKGRSCQFRYLSRQSDRENDPDAIWRQLKFGDHPVTSVYQKEEQPCLI